MSENQLSRLPFSTKRITKIMFYAKRKEHLENRELLLPGTSLTANEGLNLLHEYGIMLKKAIRIRCCEPIITDIISHINFENNSNIDVRTQNTTLFSNFLGIYLGKEELQKFCSQIEQVPKNLISERNRKELLSRIGSEFGYDA